MKCSEQTLTSKIISNSIIFKKRKKMETIHKACLIIHKGFLSNDIGELNV